MQNIIKHGQVISDDWCLLRPEDDGSLAKTPADADVIIPWQHWQTDPQIWQAHSGRCAVWLAPEDDPADLVPFMRNFTLIAVDFPNFTDGRGYSIARLLRERYSFAQELRALGDVWQDQLQALWQVGFDSFEIKQDKLLEGSTAALEAFSDAYQSNYRQPEPLFRRSIISA